MTVHNLAEWHERMATVERDEAMRQFHLDAAVVLRLIAEAEGAASLVPDFEQHARQLIVLIDPEAEAYVPEDELARQAVADLQAAVAKGLRLIWNAGRIF
jgi:hypothetical protein